MTATQAPTPGPLTSESVKLLVKGDLLRVIDPLTDDHQAGDVAVVSGTIAISSTEDWVTIKIGDATVEQRPSRFAFIGRPDADGWMPWSGGENPVGKYDVAEIKRRDGTHVIDAAHKFDWLHSPRRSDPDDIIAFRLAPTAPVEASGSEQIGAVIERLTADADCLVGNYSDGDDRNRMGKDIFALLSARPLALGGQQDRLAERIKHQVECSSANLIKSGSDKDMVAICLGHFNDLANEVAALSTTPARAEAQDEGAAGEPVARFTEGVGVPSFYEREDQLPFDVMDEEAIERWRKMGREGDGHELIANRNSIRRFVALIDRIRFYQPLYAHPSPTPAADADRVRIAALEDEVRLLNEERTFWRKLGPKRDAYRSLCKTDYERELYSLWRYAESRVDVWRGIASAMGFEPRAHDKVKPTDPWLLERITKYRAEVASTALKSTAAKEGGE